MARFLRRTWQQRITGIDIPRRDRQRCVYEAYVPDRLVNREIVLESSVMADVADAERAIVQLNERAKALIDTEALARILLRAESVASSRIEGLEIGVRRLLEANAAMQDGKTTNDLTAREVLNNIRAMECAVERVTAETEISINLLLEAHAQLFASTRLACFGGVLRTEQNWIGGSQYNPCTATFVPPPPEFVHELLEDLCLFCNGDILPAVVQAAIAHAQFETIHPFVDGNGRIGRLLIHLILKKRRLAHRVVPPISLILATNADGYIAALQATHYRGTSSSREAREGINRWVAEFSIACQRAVADATNFEERIEQLEKNWKRRLGELRGDATAIHLLKHLPGVPVLSVSTAAKLVGRSFTVTNEAIAQLVAANILLERHKGRRNRVFEVEGIIEAFTSLERRLATPGGDTRLQAPVRPVPQRRKG